MGKDNIYSSFNHFDKDCDGLLDLEDFEQLCCGLLRNDRGFVYKLENSKLQEIFDVFDRDADGYLNYEEFEFAWKSWCRYVIQPRSAIVVSSMQNDFISGKMAMKDLDAGQDATEIIKPINELVPAFKEVVFTQDWHPHNHISFLCNVHTRPLHESSPISADKAQNFDTVIFDINGEPYPQKVWPEHCIQKTWGAEFDIDLIIPPNYSIVLKGTDPDKEIGSVFGGVTNDKLSFEEYLTRKNITDVYFCGIALDVSVRDSGIDALSYGYRTTIVEDCCVGINLAKIEETKSSFMQKGGLIVCSPNVRNMLEGKDRRAEHAYQLAMKIKSSLNKQCNEPSLHEESTE